MMLMFGAVLRGPARLHIAWEGNSTGFFFWR